MYNYIGILHFGDNENVKDQENLSAIKLKTIALTYRYCFFVLGNNLLTW